MSDKERGKAIQELLRQERWGDAAELLRAWTTRFPNHAPGWFWLASCLERLGRVDEALASARRSLVLAPTETRVEVLVRRLQAGLDGEMTAVDTVQPAAEASSAADEEPDSTLVDSGRPTTDGDGEETLVEGAPEVSQGDPTLVEPSSAPGSVEATWAEAFDATADGGEASVTLREERRSTPSRQSPRSDQQWTEGAVVEGRYNVSTEDIREVAKVALRHRVVLNIRGETEGVDSDQIIDELLDHVRK